MAGTEGWSRIVYSKDERGVIVDSKVIGADDEVPDGFESNVDYTAIYDVRQDHQEPVAESVLTPWDTPTGPSSKVAKSSDEVSDGTPRETREQAGEDLTGAEEEVDDLLDEDEGDEPEDSDEVDEGSPRQAREQSEDGELTEAEEEQDDDSTQPPPQGGPGSGRVTWEQYAAAKGVLVSENDTRDDIVAAVKKAGHPV